MPNIVDTRHHYLDNSFLWPLKYMMDNPILIIFYLAWENPSENNYITPYMETWFGKCSKISKTFFFLLTNEMYVFQYWFSQNACQNSKQRRTWWDCFCRSSLIWVCPVCLGLFCWFGILEYLPYIYIFPGDRVRFGAATGGRWGPQYSSTGGCTTTYLVYSGSKLT